MDHDSMAGSREFIEAGEILGIAATVGFECRVDMSGTPFNGKRINNTEQDSVAYVAAHGVPHQNIDAAQNWLTPYREKRDIRSRGMTANINRVLAGTGIELDFERDVAAISQNHNGGTITDRHILYALSLQMMERIGRGQILIDFLAGAPAVNITGKTRGLLLDTDNPMYAYYILGALRAGFMDKFYIDAAEELPDVREFIRFTGSIAAISAYAYLGDVGVSVTGDKRAEKYEDDYLDELIPWIADIGFNAVTYMPTRNTPEQLAKLICLCEKHGLFQISGEVICPALEKPEYMHLIESTYALVGHDKSEKGMFSAEAKAQFPGLPERIKHYAALGRG
jgi:hypothetical protein